MNRVAVLFDNFGPYHLARLKGAGEMLNVLGVEFGGSSQEYAWERANTAQSLKIVTLFPKTSSRQASTRDLRKRMGEVLKDFAPNVVAIPGWTGRGAFLAMEWCQRNRVPAIVMSESTAHDEVRSGWSEWVKRRYVALCSAALVGGTPHRDYMRQLGMADDRIFEGYDAVDNGYFASEVAELRNAAFGTRKEKTLPENYFLASARFIPKKNLGRLIEAYAQYRKLAGRSTLNAQRSTPEIWSLVLLGDGELRSALSAQISALNLLDHVHLPGFIQYPELPAYYGLARAFIHASTTEQWGLVVNEAMASGLPVLVSHRCGCAPDLVQEGINGFTFDPENIEQLANLMFELSTNDNAPVGQIGGAMSSDSVQLSTFGPASQKIIAQWGPDRFAEGLLAAANTAKSFPVPRYCSLDRALLSLLIAR